ncbi:hypothetical protein KIPB_000010 [Kipferlia bialata]|uniref:CCT domain-containing protein n=1 Tax=Kipferlia bialata TaxID=797122 RepID=A0A9K3CLC1_9EUKA|nr:hypothetical protein KIPB_000010 [Kipferlia bialata]|eukprot:g10.t1
MYPQYGSSYDPSLPSYMAPVPDTQPTSNILYRDDPMPYSSAYNPFGSVPADPYLQPIQLSDSPPEPYLPYLPPPVSTGVPIPPSGPIPQYSPPAAPPAFPLSPIELPQGSLPTSAPFASRASFGGYQPGYPVNPAGFRYSGPRLDPLGIEAPAPAPAYTQPQFMSRYSPHTQGTTGGIKPLANTFNPRAPPPTFPQPQPGAQFPAHVSYGSRVEGVVGHGSIGSRFLIPNSEGLRGRKQGRDIGDYNPEARAQLLSDFYAHRTHRIHTREIKYAVRQKLANSRVRVKGRFVRKGEEAEVKAERERENQPVKPEPQQRHTNPPTQDAKRSHREYEPPSASQSPTGSESTQGEREGGDGAGQVDLEDQLNIVSVIPRNVPTKASLSASFMRLSISLSSLPFTGAKRGLAERSVSQVAVGPQSATPSLSDVDSMTVPFETIADVVIEDD